MFFLREMIDNDYKSIGIFMIDHCFKWVELESSKACVCLHFWRVVLFGKRGMLWHWLVPEVFSPFCIFWVWGYIVSLYHIIINTYFMAILTHSSSDCTLRGGRWWKMRVWWYEVIGGTRWYSHQSRSCWIISIIFSNIHLLISIK